MRPLRVMVVDDNRAAADLLVRLLTLMGYKATAAYDGRSALSVNNLFQADVVFMDLVMPEMDGFEACQRLRELKGSAVKICALSAFADPRVQAAVDELGFDAFMRKPATAELLVGLLGKWQLGRISSLVSKTRQETPKPH